MNTALLETSKLSAEWNVFLELAGVAKQQNATDIHISPGRPVMVRLKGQLVSASYLITERKFDLSVFSAVGEILPEAFERMEKALIGEPPYRDTIVTKVMVGRALRIRVNYSPLIKPKSMHIRIQPLDPFHIDNYLRDFPAVKKALRMSNGLNVITGPIGGGKTSLQSAIINYWCNDGITVRHALSISDCEEFVAAKGALATSLLCSLSDSDRNKPEVHHISDVVKIALRSDIDALSVGEIREAGAFQVALDFAATKEPVVATLHGASIAGAIIRMIGMAERVMSPETARLTLANCLDGVLYVNIVHNRKGETVPVVEYLSISESKGVRTAIQNGERINVNQAVTNAMRTDAGGTTPTNVVFEILRKRGLADGEVEKALGRDTTRS